MRSEQHLSHVVREYLSHVVREYLEHYPPLQLGAGPIQRLDRLGGLIHHYERTAA